MCLLKYHLWCLLGCVISSVTCVVMGATTPSIGVEVTNIMDVSLTYGCVEGLKEKFESSLSSLTISSEDCRASFLKMPHLIQSMCQKNLIFWSFIDHCTHKVALVSPILDVLP